MAGEKYPGNQQVVVNCMKSLVALVLIGIPDNTKIFRTVNNPEQAQLLQDAQENGLTYGS